MKTRESSLHNHVLFKSRIKVLGLGGAGGNTIHRLANLRIPGITLAAANSDAQALSACQADEKIALGVDLTHGLGSGGNPQIGKRAAEESFRELIACIRDTDLLFLTAGMGGGTGSGAIEIVARIAQSLNIMTIAVVTMPFSFESGTRSQNALEAASRLQPFTDTLITIPNDRLMSLATKETSLSTAFAMADDLLTKAIQGLSALIQSDGLLTLDISHVLRLMRQAGGCYISTGIGSGENKVIQALESALRHPMLDEVPIQNAGGLIVKFSGAISLLEIQDAVEYLRSQTYETIEIITAVSEDDLLYSANQVQVMLLVTGIGGILFEESPIFTKDKLILEAEGDEEAIPISGRFPEIGFTPSEPIPDELEVPAFLRRGYNHLEHWLTYDG